MVKLTDTQIERVKMLEGVGGVLTPDAVVADAKQEDSPLHDLFEWDVAKAAEARWLDTARIIIRTVTVVITTTTATMKVPYYTRDPDVKGQGYRSVEALRVDPVSARQALIDDLKRAAGCLARSQRVAAALNLSDELDELVHRITGLQRLVDPTMGEAPSTEVHPS